MGRETTVRPPAMSGHRCMNPDPDMGGQDLTIMARWSR
jgi:hypothetical protein